jgi:hypothetical protein
VIFDSFFTPEMMKSRANSQSLREGGRVRGTFGMGNKIGTILSVRAPRYTVLWDDDTTEERHGDQLEPFIPMVVVSQSSSSNDRCQVPGCVSDRIHIFNSAINRRVCTDHKGFTLREYIEALDIIVNPSSTDITSSTGAVVSQTEDEVNEDGAGDVDQEEIDSVVSLEANPDAIDLL